MATSEEELLALAIDGDRDAVGTLLQRYGPQVRNRLAGKIARHWQSVLTADDILQVTYLEAFMHIGRFKPAGAGSFLAWLTRIAENNLRDAVKSLEAEKRPDPRRQVRPQGDDSYVALIELLGGTSTTPSRHAAKAEVRAALESAIAGLPEDYAKVVRMYDLEGRSASEVADSMGRSPGAIFMLRARAHDRLPDLLGSSTAFFIDSA